MTRNGDVSHPCRRDPRPSRWLLGPILSAFAIFGWTHQDIGFAAWWGLIIGFAYCHRFLIDAPGRQNWLETMTLGIAANLLCLTYYVVVLTQGMEIDALQRLSHRPGIVSITCMMLIIATVWLSHLPGRASRKTGPLIVCSSFIVILSAPPLSPSPITLNLLAVFGGTIVLTLLALGGGLNRPPAKRLKAHLYQSLIVLGCIATISFGTLTLSSGLRHLKPWLNQLLSDLAPGNRDRERLGVGDRIQISRQRRITLSRRVVATITGATNPGYLRTQVMTDYHHYQWTSDPAPPRPLIGDWQPQGHRRYLTPTTVNTTHRNSTQSAQSTQPPAVVHQVQLLADLRGAVPLPYTTNRVSTSATLSCMLTAGDVVQCTPPEELVSYTIEHRPTSPSIPYGIGAALRPLPQIATSQQFLDLRHRARLVPAAVIKPLRQFAHQLVGPAPVQPLQAAQTLQQYFKRHYTYSLEVNLSQNGDPIVDFVLNRRPAYCQYFASGMVLLLRSLGIPARVVGGFVVWERHPGTHQWIVRQRDAHAWAEVYDSVSGRWVAFDATPSTRNQWFSQRGLGGAIDRVIIWLERKLRAVITWANRVDIRRWLNQLGTQILRALLHPIIAITAGFCILCAVLWRHWPQGQLYVPPWARSARWLPRWRRKRSEAKDHNPITAQAQSQFKRVATALAQRGTPIQRSETLQEYCHRIAPDPTNPNTATLTTTLIDFTDIYKALRFQPCTSVNRQPQLATLEQLADEIVQIASDPPDGHLTHAVAK